MQRNASLTRFPEGGHVSSAATHGERSIARRPAASDETRGQERFDLAFLASIWTIAAAMSSSEIWAVFQVAS